METITCPTMYAFRQAQRKDLRHVRLAYKSYFFSQQTIFFSHNKLANNIFSHGLSRALIVSSSSNMDFLGVLLYVYERLSARAVPGHQALRRQEAKYTAMDDERRSHAARQDTA